MAQEVKPPIDPSLGAHFEAEHLKRLRSQVIALAVLTIVVGTVLLVWSAVVVTSMACGKI